MGKFEDNFINFNNIYGEKKIRNFDFGSFYKTNFDKLTKNTLKYISYAILSIFILYKINQVNSFDIKNKTFIEKTKTFIEKNKEEIFELLINN